jgi:type I restriction enzyme, R subunit
MREANRRGEQLNLTDDELAFYDVLEVNDSAVNVLGDETLRQIAIGLVNTIRNNITIDWIVGLFDRQDLHSRRQERQKDNF